MNKKTVILMIVMVLSILSCSKNSYREKFFSTEFYFKHYVSLDGNPEKTQIARTNKNQSIEMINRAIEYKKKKEYQKAVDEIEQSLVIYCDSYSFYEYGNALMNLKDYENALKAYKVADDNYFENQHYLDYNIACVYSKLKKVSESYKYLKLAILNGYPNIEFIFSDPDLQELRNAPGWNAKKDELKKLYSDGNTIYFCNKEIEEGVASENRIYYFYDQNRVVKHEIISDTKDDIEIGHWQYKNYIITITFTRDKGKRGIGVGHVVGNGAVFDSYESFDEVINKTIRLNWNDIKNCDNGNWEIRDISMSYDKLIQ
jgi:tetratricopeptide (TPR) repeat protein